MRRRPIFCADINLAAAEKTAGIIRSEGGEAVANHADEEQTSPTAANLARTYATAHYSSEARCIGALWCAYRTLPGSHQLKIMAIALCRSIGAVLKGLWCCVAQRRRLWFCVAQTLRPSRCGNCLKLVQFFERNNRIAAAWNADTQQGTHGSRGL